MNIDNQGRKKGEREDKNWSRSKEEIMPQTQTQGIRGKILKSERSFNVRNES